MTLLLAFLKAELISLPKKKKKKKKKPTLVYISILQHICPVQGVRLQ
jgi:hypothetical protein